MRHAGGTRRTPSGQQPVRERENPRGKGRAAATLPPRSPAALRRRDQRAHCRVKDCPPQPPSPSPSLAPAAADGIGKTLGGRRRIRERCTRGTPGSGSAPSSLAGRRTGPRGGRGRGGTRPGSSHTRCSSKGARRGGKRWSACRWHRYSTHRLHHCPSRAPEAATGQQMDADPPAAVGV